MAHQADGHIVSADSIDGAQCRQLTEQVSTAIDRANKDLRCKPVSDLALGVWLHRHRVFNVCGMKSERLHFLAQCRVLAHGG